jgi:hypothetical protein
MTQSLCGQRNYQLHIPPVVVNSIQHFRSGQGHSAPLQYSIEADARLGIGARRECSQN